MRRKNVLPVVGSMGVEIRLVAAEPNRMPQFVLMPTLESLVCDCNVQPR